MNEAHIAGMGTAVPHRISTERFVEVDREMRARHGQSADIADTIARLARGTGVVARHTVHPAWLPASEAPSDVEDIFTKTDFDPPFWQRQRAWREHMPKLAVEAARRALDDWGGPLSDVTHIVVTGTSGWTEPGIAYEVIHQLGLPLTCQKAELYFNGCFAGGTCLRLGRDIVRAGDARAVLVVAGELASTHYNVVDTDISTLVANVLFADGAAAIVLAPEGRWRYQRTGMSLVPNSGDMLTMEPPSRPGQESYRMFLHREVGAKLGEYFASGDGRRLLTDLIAACDGELPAMAVHPGGPNILEGVQGPLIERGWPKDVLAASFNTLHNYGNLGSAAVLFVLANTLPTLTSDRVATFAFGPGVTVEWALLQRAD